MASCYEDEFRLQGSFFDDFVDDSEFLAACEAMRPHESSFAAQSTDAKVAVSSWRTNEKGLAIVKAAKKVALKAKFRNKIFRPRGGEIDNNAAVNSVQYRRQLRRRGNQAMLYSFPSFDRCDSLLFLPSTMMRHVNASDLTALGKMFHSYMDKNCSAYISYLGDEEINVNGLLRFHTLLNELNPDAIVCVHNTQVVENQIRATAYTKYTANKTIYDSVSRSTKDPLFEPMFGLQRDESVIRNLKREGRPNEEINKLTTTVVNNVAGCDLLLYVRLDLVYTFDNFTKKITRYNVTETLTSIVPVCVDYSQ